MPPATTNHLPDADIPRPMATGTLPTVNSSVDFCILAFAVAADVLRLTLRMTKFCDPSAALTSLHLFDKGVY